tara:strand:+ start:254 stop:433 length:180 start_codon:yes stop_codon:yes gene_type:complete
MAKKKKEKKTGLGAAVAKVKARPSGRRAAERKADVKAPAARRRKGTATSGGRRSRGSGK